MIRATATGVVVWTSLATLNLAIGVLLLTARPVRVANVLAAGLIVTNGLYGVLTAYFESVASSRYADDLNLVLNMPVFTVFILFPYFFPRRRLGRVAGRWVIAAGLAYMASPLPFVLWWPDVIGNSMTSAPPHTLLKALLQICLFAPFIIGLGVGTLVLLHEFLTTPDRAIREQARFLLAAYVLKVGSYAVLTTTVTMTYLHVTDPAPVLEPSTYIKVLHASATVLYLFPFVAVLIAILRSAWRSGKEPSQATPKVTDHLFILGFMALAIVLVEGIAQEAEYMLLRPLLFAYAILHFQMLELDLRRRAPLIAVIALSGLAGAYLITVQALEGHGVSSSAATGIGIMALLSLIVLLAWPLARRLATPIDVDADAARAREIYRVALDGAGGAAIGDASTYDSILRALRSRLGISDREHETMAARIGGGLGAEGGPIAPGKLVFGRFRIERSLGEGGFGRTFLARDETIGRPVVLKVARADGDDDARRMMKEARALAALRHERIVTLYDVERVGAECVLVLEYVAGGSLADRLARGRLPAKETTQVALDVIDALQAAHAAGIVHRDVKPANILLDDAGRAKLADFGIVRLLDAGQTATGITLPGVQPGSLRYMSPEQVRGAPVDERTDLYSLGVVLYEAVAGQPYLPAVGRPDIEVRLAIVQDEPRYPVPGADRRLDGAIRAMLRKDAGRRVASAEEVRSLLDRGAKDVRAGDAKPGRRSRGAATTG